MRGRGPNLDAADALVADMRAAWDEHRVREDRFQVRMNEKSRAIAPSIEEAIRRMGEIVEGFDFDA